MDKIKNVLICMGKDLWSIRIPLLLIGLYLIGTVLIWGKVCPFWIVTGLPCPGCGLTRAGLMVIRGEFADAVKTNLTIFLWIPFLVYGIIARYFIKVWQKKFKGILIILLLITLLYYGVRMVWIFPESSMLYSANLET